MSNFQSNKSAKAYVRVSTTMQVDDGVSLETQVTRIKEYCTYMKLDLVKVYEDAGISGKNMNRPALIEMLNEIQSGDNIIFYDLSRLGRDTKDTLTIHETIHAKGATMICLNPNIDFSTPAGEMMMSFLAATYKYERQNTSKKVSDNMKRLKAEGKLRARSPFGYKFVGKDKDLEAVPEQQEIIKYIIESHKSGMSDNKIATILNTNGYGYIMNLNKKKATANPSFFNSTIRRILIDNEIVEDEKRRPIEQRITSFHKPQEQTPNL